MSYPIKHETGVKATRIERYTAAATLSVALLAGGDATFASTLNAPPITVDGARVTVAGLERNNSVFVPVRGFFEKLGARVTDSGSSLVARRQGKELARLTVGSRKATVNGSAQTLPVAPFMAQGVAMLPLRFISEAAGASVRYLTSPRGIAVTHRSRASVAGAAAGVAAVAGAAAAPVTRAAAPVPASAATDAASAAPIADSHAADSGIPWWVWALLALLILGLILWALTKRNKEPIITTSSKGRKNDPTITTRK